MERVILATEEKELEEENEKHPTNRRCDPDKINIDEEARMCLIEWVCELKDVYELTDETCETSVLLMDVTFASKFWSIGQFQLICATSLFIAAKYEETFYPALSEFVFLCDGLYKREEFLKMESYIVKIMDFRLTRMNFHSFAKFTVFPYSPPEDYLTCMSVVATKLLAVKGCLLVDQIKFANIMLQIIEKGYSEDAINTDDADSETKDLTASMIRTLKKWERLNL